MHRILVAPSRPFLEVKGADAYVAARLLMIVTSHEATSIDAMAPMVEADIAADPWDLTRPLIPCLGSKHETNAAA